MVMTTYLAGWSEGRIHEFVHVLDWLMNLPEPQKTFYEAALGELERRLNMPYVNSMVRDAVKCGEE